MMSIVGPIIGANKNLQYLRQKQEITEKADEDTIKSNREQLDKLIAQRSVASFNAGNLGGRPPEDLQGFSERMRGLSEQEKQPILADIRARRAALIADVTQTINQFAGTIKNPSEAEAILKNAVRPYDEQIALLTDDNYDLMHYQAHQEQARVNDAMSQWGMENPAVIARTNPLIKQLCEDDPTLCQKLINLGGGNDASKIDSLFRSHFDKAENVFPVDAVGKVKMQGLDGEKIGKGIDLIQNAASNPKLSKDTRLDYINQFYTPPNYKFTSLFAPPSVNPATGARSMGNVDVFSKAVNPQFLKEADKLGQIQTVFNWAKNALSQDIFRKEIVNLEKYGKYEPTTFRGQQVPPRVSISYDDETKHLKAHFDPRYGNIKDQTQLEIENSIETINTAMDAFGNFAPYVAEGENPTVFAAQVLHDNGYLTLQGIPNTVPEMIGAALGRGILTKPEEETTGISPRSGKRHP